MDILRFLLRGKQLSKISQTAYWIAFITLVYATSYCGLEILLCGGLLFTSVEKTCALSCQYNAVNISAHYLHLL